MNIDLSNQNLNTHINAYHDLQSRPSFSVSGDTDLHVRFFERRDKHFEIRTAKKVHFESRTEFLVSSVLIEEIRAHIQNKLKLEDLATEDCSIDELSELFSHAEKIDQYLPKIDNVLSAQTIKNGSSLNWIFIEEEDKYHSLFWNESTTKLFKRSA